MTDTNIMLDNRDAIRIITVDHPPANTWDLVTVEAFEQVIDDVLFEHSAARIGFSRQHTGNGGGVMNHNASGK